MSSNKIQLHRFQVSDDERVITMQRRPSVSFPKCPFRIHPDPNRVVRNLVVTRVEGYWHLVDVDVRDVMDAAGFIVLIANLYEGVRDNDESFLLPVTRSRDPRRWYNSAIRLMKRARRVWVRREADEENQQHLCFDVELDKEPVWSDDFTALVERAFEGRIITLEHPILRKILNKRLQEIIDEIED